MWHDFTIVIKKPTFFQTEPNFCVKTKNSRIKYHKFKLVNNEFNLFLFCLGSKNIDQRLQAL